MSNSLSRILSPKQIICLPFPEFCILHLDLGHEQPKRSGSGPKCEKCSNMKNSISFIIMDLKNYILLIMLRCISSKLCQFYPNPNPLRFIYKHCVGSILAQVVHMMTVDWVLELLVT